MKRTHDGATTPARSTILTLLCLALPLLGLVALVPPAGAASGDLAWQRVFNGLDNGSDAFSSAVSAPNGGVYVAGHVADVGYDVLVARYDSAGQRRWLRTYNGRGSTDDDALGAAADGHGDLVVVGTANDAIMVVLKYGPGGQRRWVRLYDDPTSGQEAATNVVVDAAGNIYVAGYRSPAASGNEIVLIKYSASGARKWLRSYARPGSNDDRPNDIAIDGAGNVYITGSSTGAGGYYDALTLKFDPAGHRRWARNWEGSAGGYDSGFAIAVSPDGTVYVAGQTAGIASGDDAVVLKYSTAGVLRWSRFRTSAGAMADQFSDIALLGNGDVAAAGRIYGGPDAVDDVLLARFSPAGTTRWQRAYDGPDGNDDIGRHMAVGASGAIYVNGYSYGNATASDILTLKYGGSGAFRWARRYTSAGGSSSDSDGALIATAGGVYVAGQQQPVSTSDAVLLKYRP